MAGCEYLPNIERVGLKKAIKHFETEKDFEGVMKLLEKSKIHKERIPADYNLKAKFVYDLFNF